MINLLKTIRGIIWMAGFIFGNAFLTIFLGYVLRIEKYKIKPMD